jgi:hypothetical protein
MNGVIKFVKLVEEIAGMISKKLIVKKEIYYGI